MIELNPNITLSEMYSGPGGLGVGAQLAKVKHNGLKYGFKHIWATDYDKDTCSTYAQNLNRNNSMEVICSDVKNLDIKSLKHTDGFMFGFPCNDFSLVGETKGLYGKFGGLYAYGVQYIEYANPLFFLAENVSGLSSANDGEAIKIILRALTSAGKFGYNITSHLYKFEQYGVPQARHRYVLIGIRKDLETFYKVPKPLTKIVTVREALNKPIAPEIKNNDFTKQSKIVVERLKHIKPGENAWNANIPNDLKLNVKGAKLSQIYKRLEPDKPSYTVTGSGGGGTHIYHWEENRSLTNRERARLQTFPDTFEFIGGKESVRKQIGMAVPPIAAKHMLMAVIKTLLQIDYESVNPSHGFFD